MIGKIVMMVNGILNITRVLVHQVLKNLKNISKTKRLFILNIMEKIVLILSIKLLIKN